MAKRGNPCRFERAQYGRQTPDQGGPYLPVIATSTTYYFIIHSWRMYDRGKTGGIEEAQNDVPARLVPRWIQPRCRFAPLWHQIRLEHESWQGHGDVTTIALHASLPVKQSALMCVRQSHCCGWCA